MELITVFTTLNLAEADLAASELEAAGFDVMIPDEYSALSLGSSGGQTGLSSAKSSGGIRVQVPEDQAAEARALIEATIASKTVEPSPGEAPAPAP